jgi:hypothetical protein
MTDPKYMRPGLGFAVGKAVEELGELQAALGKTLRWGWDSVNPELPLAQQEPNKAWVIREILDVRAALDNLEQEVGKIYEPGNVQWATPSQQAGALEALNQSHSRRPHE